MAQFVLPISINLLVPGSGLVVLGRTWVGIALTAWYCLAVEVSLYAWLVAPAAVPSWAIVITTTLAAVVWIAGQAMLISRIHFLRSPDLPRQVEILRRLASRAIARQDYRTASAALSIGLSLDGDNTALRELRLHIRGARVRRAPRP